MKTLEFQYFLFLIQRALVTSQGTYSNKYIETFDTIDTP